MYLSSLLSGTVIIISFLYKQVHGFIGHQSLTKHKILNHRRPSQVKDFDFSFYKYGLLIDPDIFMIHKSIFKLKMNNCNLHLS